VSTVLAANGTTSRPSGSPHHNNGARARTGLEGGHATSAIVTQPRSGVTPPAGAAGGRRGDATFLRCGGCTAVVLLAQRQHDYGRLVCGFLNRHEQCGNAVEISRVDSGTTRKPRTTAASPDCAVPKPASVPLDRYDTAADAGGASPGPLAASSTLG